MPSRLLSEPWELPELDRGSAGRLESACSSIVMNQVKTDDCILSKLQRVVSATLSSNGCLGYAVGEQWRAEQCSLRSLDGRLQKVLLGELRLFLIPLQNSYGRAADTCHVAHDAQIYRRAVEGKKARA